MPQFLQVAEQAAREAGGIIQDRLGNVSVREKGPKDLVTDADLASQAAIHERLIGAFPHHDFLGEESDGQQIATGAEYQWVVDPLDGTVNYAHGLQLFSVSIALRRQGQVVAGVIFDPMADEMYSAERGRGAHLNGQPLHVSSCGELSQALIAASFPSQVPVDSIEITRFVEILTRCQAIRRLGSAALNLCYLASGRLDGYFATSVNLWDVAAGLLLVEESGGHVCRLAGGQLDWEKPRFVATATLPLQHQIVRVFQEAQAQD